MNLEAGVADPFLSYKLIVDKKDTEVDIGSFDPKTIDLLQVCLLEDPCPSMTTTATTTTPLEKNAWTLYCGESYSDAEYSCANACPSGSSTECPDGQACFITSCQGMNEIGTHETDPFNIRK